MLFSYTLKSKHRFVALLENVTAQTLNLSVSMQAAPAQSRDRQAELWAGIKETQVSLANKD